MRIQNPNFTRTIFIIKFCYLRVNKLSLPTIPNTVTKAFKEQVETLVGKGVVANQQEIVDALGWNKSSMSQAMGGSKNVPVAVYRKFTNLYGLQTPEIPLNGQSQDGLKNEVVGDSTFRGLLTLI